jgi:hypothetical protein
MSKSIGQDIRSLLRHLFYEMYEIIMGWTWIKRLSLDIPTVNFPFISSNIPASPAYGAYISQLVCYSRACDRYGDFLDRAQLLMLKLLKQG